MKSNSVPMSGKVSVKAVAESAMLVALAFILSTFTVFKLLYGGSVTIGSMIPIMLVSLKYPFGWSLTVALCYSILQMFQSFYAPPVNTLINYMLMVALDYIVAFSVLCLAGPIVNMLEKKLELRIRLMIATVICFGLRFLCHFISGIIIWGVYAPKGQPVWLYSLMYNGSYLGLETIISGLILFFAGEKLVAIFAGDRS